MASSSRVGAERQSSKRNDRYTDEPPLTHSKTIPVLLTADGIIAIIFILYILAKLL